MRETVTIDNNCKISYKIDEDFIFFKNQSDIYYLITESNVLIKLKISVNDFFNKILEHIEKNVSFLYLIEERFVVVDSFIIENKEVLNEI